MVDYTNTYWNNKGTYQDMADALQELIPVQGSVDNAKKNPALEKFRKAINCYYDFYNNGLGNRAREFAKVFKFATGQYKFRDGRYGHDFSQVMYNRTDTVMDTIVLAAYQEQFNKTA